MIKKKKKANKADFLSAGQDQKYFTQISGETKRNPKHAFKVSIPEELF